MQLSFRPETPDFAPVSTSRYADPEAEGVMPVLRTFEIRPLACEISQNGSWHSHILRIESEGLVLPVALPLRFSPSSLAKTGGKVPPTGPLTRLRSAILR